MVYPSMCCTTPSESSRFKMMIKAHVDEREIFAAVWRQMNLKLTFWLKYNNVIYECANEHAFFDILLFIAVVANISHLLALIQ